MDMRVSNIAQDNANAPDEALLLCYGHGDPEAARLLTERLGPRVLSYATRLLGGDRDEAEDVTQEAMLRLWQIAPNWEQGTAQVSTWLYKVTSNLCLDRLRKTRPNYLDPETVPEDGQPSAVAKLQDQARLSALHQELRTLPDRQRQAVILRHIEGLNNPEIALIIGISIEAVESLTARGKRALATAMSTRKKELGYTDE